MKAVIALGSNLGDRSENLRSAVIQLEKIIKNLRHSEFMESKAIGGPVQGDYLNAIAIGDSDLDPEKLLTDLLSIEDRMGRVRAEKWGPRTIDLDLICFGNQVINTAFLQLPHPLAHTREFVIAPWFSIDPNGVIPGVGEIKNILASLKRKS